MPISMTFIYHKTEVRNVLFLCKLYYIYEDYVS
jgi:hypothetical protein